ncbi:MAG: hypothetical protein ACI4KJ_03440 [Anaerovoracaceae bacterium]
MSVSFTGESEAVMIDKGYISDDSEIGKVYYPSKGVTCDDEIEVLYERKPWLEAFRVVGIRPVLEKRSGPGTVTREEFARLSAEFYPEGSVMRECLPFEGRVLHGEAGSYLEYYLRMAEFFCKLASEASGAGKGDSRRLRAAQFIGFIENMWREGDAWTLQLVKDEILPVIYRNEDSRAILNDTASEDFGEYVRGLI